MPLVGEIVDLREIREEDLPMFVALRNDLATQGWSRTLPTDYTLEMIRRRYWERDFDFRRDEAIFIVEEKASKRATGMISYTGLIDRMEATWGLSIRQEYWGTGVALDAGETLMRFLFHELGLRVVRLHTQTENERAVAAFEKMGFKVATRMPDGIFKAGRPADNLSMDILREEWYARHPDLVDRLSDSFSPEG